MTLGFRLNDCIEEVAMSQTTSHRAEASESTGGAEVDRRRFIDLCSKYAVAAPPAIALLVAATEAEAHCNPGRQDRGRSKHKGFGCSVHD